MGHVEREARPPVAIAVAQHRQVDGEHDRPVAGRRRALDEAPRPARVGLGVELEEARAPGAAAAISSIEALDIVEGMNGIPAAAAARAVASSASGWARPCGAIGAIATGIDAGAAEERRRGSIRETSTSTRGRKR